MEVGIEVGIEVEVEVEVVVESKRANYFSAYSAISVTQRLITILKCQT